MDNTQDFENGVLERLNAGKSVKNLLITAIDLLNDAINILVLQVFRKDDYAVKYAVGPLLEGDGPLCSLSVRLKLVYGLGILSRAEYQDCELLMSMGDRVNQEACDPHFTDDQMLYQFGELHCVEGFPSSPVVLEGSDPVLHAMQQQRSQQIVRSTLVLSLTALISRISAKTVFSK